MQTVPPASPSPKQKKSIFSDQSRPIPPEGLFISLQFENTGQGIVVSRLLPFSPGDIALRAVVSKEFATTGLLHFQKALWGATSSPSSSGKGPATRMGFCPALNTVRHGRLIVGLSLLAPVSFFNVVSSTP
jgi:hypothetical protein